MPFIAMTSIDIALILAIFSIAQMIFSPFNGAIKNKIGGKNAIIIGFLIVTLTSFSLGLLTYFKYP